MSTGNLLLVSPHCSMRCQGTQTDFKNELLHSKFGINYNSLPPQFRKVGISSAPGQKTLGSIPHLVVDRHTYLHTNYYTAEKSRRSAHMELFMTCPVQFAILANCAE